MKKEELTVKIKYSDLQKHGVDWERLCEKTGINIWAANEGLVSEDTVLDVPISLVATNQEGA